LNPASTLLLGLLLGLRHATDPDHVVAMGTFVTQDTHLRRAVGTGLFWGIGHTATVLGVGVLMILGGVRVPDRAVTAMELAVGAMLIVLGVVAIRTQGPAPAPAPAPAPRPSLLLSPLRPLLVGVVHGLAGSAAMTLLALATLRDARAALAYLGLFGVGTIAGMILITLLLAISLRWAAGRSKKLPRIVARASGTLSVLAGVFVVLRTLSPP